MNIDSMELVEEDDSITIAIPKGRVLKQLVPRFEAAGINTEALTKESRKLIRSSTTEDGVALHFLLLKPDDVPTYVEYGAADLGVVGRDVLLERPYDLYAPVDLGIGRCKLAVAGKPGFSMETAKILRVATKFPTIAAKHFEEKGQPIELIFVQGSVELAPITGLADVIVDIVETGKTLRSNGLGVLEDVCEISSLVIANRVALKLKQKRIRPLLDKLK
ncbi:MAG: ATP phosphoribosyltransferase [Polyangiales bacterium]|jgi:ATP phosphoribosyltransferase